MPASLEGSSVEKVSLTDGWPKIPKSAFENAENLKEISIPDSVTEIVSWASKNCTSLEDLTIPETVTSLGDYVFENCDSLTEFTIPESVTEIGNGAFLYCDSLKTLLWNHQLTYVPGSAAAYCRSLTTFKYPEAKQEEPGAYAFPDILESIDSEAFRECDSLTKVTLPDSVTEIGDSAFENCDSLTEVTLPDTVCRLKQYAFYDCDSLTTVRLSQGLTEIRNNLFEHCDALTSIIIPRLVKGIGYRAFRNCTSLTSVTLPRSLEHVDDEVFSYPKKMTIYGVPDSYAQSYAEEIGSKFEPLEVPAQSASFQVDELQLYNWSSFRLVLSVTPDHFTDEVIWKSSDPDIVSVEEDGTITARNTGDAKITASAGNCSAVCKVRVIQPVTSLWLDRDDLSIELNETLQLVANIHPDNAYNREVRWESSDESTVYVNENGLITALKTGSAIITVTSVDNETIKDTCKVTVTNFAHRCSTVEEMESPHPYPNNSKDYWIYSIPEANSLLVTFDAKTEVEEKYDYIEIYDSTNRLLGRYTGTELAGKTIRIPGELVKILLNSDAAGTGWGFQVTAIQGLDKCYDGHDWDDGIITKPATETEEGIIFYTCKNDSSHTKTESVPKLIHQHRLTKTDKVEATCTADGIEAYWTCEGCGKLFFDAEGKSEIEKPVEIKASGHSMVTMPAVPATCTETGLTEGSKCSVCGEILLKQEEIPMIDHIWDVGTITKAATVSATGIKTYTCTVCGATKTETLPKLKTNTLTIKTASKSYAYSTKAQNFSIGISKAQGAVTYTLDKAAKTAKITVKNGKVTIPKSCAVGTYKITVKTAGNVAYAAGSKVVTIKITQAVNPLTIKVSSKSYYSSKLKKAAAFTIGATKGQGKVTYTPNTAAKKAKIKVAAAGKVTVPKKCRKGTYKITVKAAGNKNYKAGTKTVTIKVK